MRKPIRNLPDKLMRHIGRRAKVVGVRGIEWEVRVRAPADALAICIHTAHIPEGPSRGDRSAWNIVRIGLEEVDLIQRGAVAGAAQQCEKDQ